MEEIESGLVKKVSCAAQSDETVPVFESNYLALTNVRREIGLIRPTATIGNPPQLKYV